MKPGVYFNLSNAEYHGGPGINKGLLDAVRRSPMHARHSLDVREQGANDNEPTPAQVIGTAFHALLLEPELFAKTYTLALRKMDVPEAIEDREILVGMVQELNAGRLAKLPTTGTKTEQAERVLAAWNEMPGAAESSPLPANLSECPAATLKAEIARLNESRPGLLPTSGSRHELAQLLRDAGRPVTLWSDVQAEWAQNNAHRIVLGAEQFDQLQAMRRAVEADPAARALMNNAPGVAEMSVYWTDQKTGALCRCRPDFHRQDGIIVDVKTTEDASPEEFARSVANWRYHVQDAYYLEGCQAAYDAGHYPEGWARPRMFVFLAVEKKAPHAVGVYILDEDSREVGRVAARQDLDTLANCMSAGKWPGFGGRVRKISLPDWELRRAELSRERAEYLQALADASRDDHESAAEEARAKAKAARVAA